MSRDFRIESLDKKHKRSEFDCGVQQLNEYFRVRVGQDIRRRVTACYVAIDNETDCVAGYYTLAAYGVALTDLPEDTSKRLPRYPTVPAVKIGRLAVDKRYRGRRLGGALLFDAINRTCRSDIAAFALIVDAKDEEAVTFYEHFGFQRFDDTEQALFISISDALRKKTQN